MRGSKVIFISIFVDKLPMGRRKFARRLGWFIAMFMRIGLLLVLARIAGPMAPLFTVPGREIIAAVGRGDDVRAMMAAVVASVALILRFAGPIGRFVAAHHTRKMLAVSFRLVAGVVLVAESFDHHVPAGYVYFAMVFSPGVEMLNINLHKRAGRVVDLHSP